MTKIRPKRRKPRQQVARRKLEKMVQARTAELHEANQTLRMITSCNEALVRATSEEHLVGEICRAVHRLGGYRMVWVGYAEYNAAKTVRPVASVGFEKGYLERAHITWANEPRGRGPTGTCIRTGKPYIGRDFRTDPELAPWREEALKRGYQSSLALPLMADGRAFGALMFYAVEPNVFGQTQTQLLTKLADDLAYGITALRAQVERDLARRQAERRAAQLRALAAELGQAEQRERLRLANLLHDDVQQLLVGAKMSVDLLVGKLDDPAQRQAARQVTEVLDQAIKASRSMAADLRPPALYGDGLVAGLIWLGRDMSEKHGLRVEVRANAAAEPDALQLRVFLFEAVRELLFNVVKHAGVNCAVVTLSRARRGRIQVTVEDRGVGFDPAPAAMDEKNKGGFGLFSIGERLGYLGGEFKIDSSPGCGSLFTLLAPTQIAVAASRSRGKVKVGVRK